MNALPLNASLGMRPVDLPPSAWTGHVPFGLWVVEAARPRVLVELGTHNGTSYFAFCQAVSEARLDTRCHAVDTWRGDAHAGFYGDEVYGAVTATNAKYQAFSQLLRMTFDEALPAFSDGSVDLLHIDGLHTYDAVKHDFESWLPKLSTRGVVLFHDTMVRERGFGVWRLWEELRDRHPSFELHHAHGLGVLLVGADAPGPLKSLAALRGTPDEATVQRLFAALGDGVIAQDEVVRLKGWLDQSQRDQAGALRAAGEAHEYLSGRVATLEQELQQARDAQDASRAEVEDALARCRHLEAVLADRDQLGEALRANLSQALATQSEQSARLARVEAAYATEARRAVDAETAAARAEAALDAARDAHRELDADHARITAELDAARAALERAAAETRGVRADAEALARERDAFMARLGDTEQAREALAREAKALEASLGAANAALDEHVAWREQLMASRSWRLTAPLRALAQRFRGRG